MSRHNAKWYAAICKANGARRGTKNAFSPKRSARMQELWSDPDYVAKQHTSRLAYWDNLDPEEKKKLVAKKIKACHSPEATRRRSLSLRLLNAMPEGKAARKQAIKTAKANGNDARTVGLRKWADPKYRARMKKVRQAQGEVQTAEQRKANSDRLKVLWQDPAYRAKQMKTRNRTMYNNPEWRKKNSEGLKRHYKTHEVWNEGFTKDDHPSLYRSSQKLKGRAPNYFRYKCWYKKNGLKIAMRSGYELRFANICDAVGIRWEYEPRYFNVGKGIWRGTSYTPDFYLPGLEIWVELKGLFTKENKAKMERFKKKYLEVNVVVLQDKQLRCLEGLIKKDFPVGLGSLYALDVTFDRLKVA